jgi:hypothetical protein
MLAAKKSFATAYLNNQVSKELFSNICTLTENNGENGLKKTLRK